MFEAQNKSNPIYPVIAAALVCFASGYALATYRARNADMQITTGQHQEVLLSYKKSPARQLQLIDGVATLGTVRERLDDLLNEDPQTIRKYTRDSLSRR